MILVNKPGYGFVPHHIGQPFVPCLPSIARALSHINRYTGHVGQYSVAQHSVLVARSLPIKYRLSGLLHDAHEAYIGDVSSPLKRHLPEYVKLESTYQDVIDAAFDVKGRHTLVRHADLAMLITEVKHFGMPLEHFPDVAPLDAVIEPMTPAEAEQMFLGAFYEYL